MSEFRTIMYFHNRSEKEAVSVMLKILGPKYERPIFQGNYRGVERPSLAYVANVGDDHEANQAFNRFLSASDLKEIIQDINLARDLVNIYGRLDPPQPFEIVEITTENHSPTIIAGTFLGFDVACVYRISLLSGGLEIDRDPPAKISASDLIWKMRPLFRLVKSYFKPRLNQNGLFDDYETAIFFLEVMMTLQQIRPKLWEDCKYEVLGLWHID